MYKYSEDSLYQLEASLNKEKAKEIGKKKYKKVKMVSRISS